MNFDLKTLDLRTGAAEKCDQLVVLVGEDFAPGSDPLARLIAQALKSKDFETKPGKSLALYQAPGIAARRLYLSEQVRATRGPCARRWPQSPPHSGLLAQSAPWSALPAA